MCGGGCIYTPDQMSLATVHLTFHMLCIRLSYGDACDLTCISWDLTCDLTCISCDLTCISCDLTCISCDLTYI